MYLFLYQNKPFSISIFQELTIQYFLRGYLYKVFTSGYLNIITCFRYQWGIGSTPDWPDIMEFKTFPYYIRSSCIAIPLQHAHKYYNIIKAYNKAINPISVNKSSDGGMGTKTAQSIQQFISVKLLSIIYLFSPFYSIDGINHYYYCCYYYYYYYYCH